MPDSDEKSTRFLSCVDLLISMVGNQEIGVDEFSDFFEYLYKGRRSETLELMLRVAKNQEANVLRGVAIALSRVGSWLHERESRELVVQLFELCLKSDDVTARVYAARSCFSWSEGELKDVLSKGGILGLVSHNDEPLVREVWLTHKK